MLVGDRQDPQELTRIRWLTHRWEQAASTRLRAGDLAVIDHYQAHERLHNGDRDTIIDAAYQAWLRDTRAGMSNLLIAADRDTVTERSLHCSPIRAAASHRATARWLLAGIALCAAKAADVH